MRIVWTTQAVHEDPETGWEWTDDFNQPAYGATLEFVERPKDRPGVAVLAWHVPLDRGVSKEELAERNGRGRR